MMNINGASIRDRMRQSIGILVRHGHAVACECMAVRLAPSLSVVRNCERPTSDRLLPRGR